MREMDIVESSSPGRGKRDLCWILITATLAGLFAFVGSAAPAAARERSDACGASAAAHTVALPSGRSETFCYAQAAPGSTTSAVPTITLSKTVSTANECGSAESLTVPTATQIYYCYRITNTGSVTVSTHDLGDDKLGQLLSGHNQTVAPGGTAQFITSAMISSDTVNNATWSASDGVDSAVGADSAQVIIGAVPGAPGIGSATPAEGEIALGWTESTDDGVHPVTGYRVTPYIAGVPQTPVDVGPDVTSKLFTGLVNGTTYTFKVTALSSIGPSADSDPSNEATPQWWLPWSSGPTAVDELFSWFTGKPPTAAEKSEWLGQLNGGSKLPGDLVAALRDGPDATGNVDPVIRLYGAYLQRKPDRPGLMFWLNRRRSGWKLSRISSNFAASSEFKRKYGTLTNEQFVTRIYTDVLARLADPSGVDYWTRQLNTHRKTRGQVMLNFSDSNEYKRKQADNVDSVAIYMFLWGRTPTVDELFGFAGELATTPLADLVREQIHLPAFADRAG